MPKRPDTNALAAVGFTDLESEILTFLAGESPATGYRIAQAIGKPVANTYKAVESLAAKDAVAFEEGATRQIHAVPTGELIGRMKRDFDRRCRAAEEALAARRRAPDDERIFALKSRRATLDCAREMLAQCREIAVADAYPGVLSEMQDDFAAAARRGVAVAIVAYAPLAIPSVEIVVHARSSGVLAAFSGESLAIVVDGEKYLMACFRPDGEPQQAVWSHSAFLSVIHHDGIVCLALTQALDHALAGNATIDQVRALRERMRRHSVIRTPGMARLAGVESAELVRLLSPVYTYPQGAPK